MHAGDKHHCSSAGRFELQCYVLYKAAIIGYRSLKLHDLESNRGRLVDDGALVVPDAGFNLVSLGKLDALPGKRVQGCIL